MVHVHTHTHTHTQLLYYAQFVESLANDDVLCVFSQDDGWTFLYHAQGAEPLTNGDVLCVFTERSDRWTLLYHAQGVERLINGSVLCVFTERSDRWTLLYHAQGAEPRRWRWWLVAADVLDRWGFLFLSISLSWVLGSPLCYDFGFPSSCLGRINRFPFYSLMGWVNSRKPNLLVGQDKLPCLAESLHEVAQHWWVVLQWGAGPSPLWSSRKWKSRRARQTWSQRKTARQQCHLPRKKDPCQSSPGATHWVGWFPRPWPVTAGCGHVFPLSALCAVLARFPLLPGLDMSFLSLHCVLCWPVA